MSAITLTESELKELIENAVSKGVQDTFLALGVDVAAPLEVQKDMQHLREWRMTVQSARSKGFLAILTTLIAGGGGLLWLGFKYSLTGAP